MTTPTETRTEQVYRVYIKAAPAAIWTAITDPDWTDRYGYGGRFEVEGDLRAGAPFKHLTSEAMRAMDAPDVAIDGEVVEADEPHRLVLTWRMVMDDGLAAEGFTRLTYEIEPLADGVSKLTVIHDLTGAPGLASMVAGDHESQGAGGGWAWTLSDLKSLLETGDAFTKA
jgi:uncharacterized protein YndB with AHSA1/START domain